MNSSLKTWRRSTAGWALAGILLLAAAVRLYGIGFGLPHPQCRPDEETISRIALGFFSGDLNPHFFNYPTFFMYAVFSLYKVYVFLSSFTGVGTMAAVLSLVNPATGYLLSRGLSAGLGILSVWLLYRLGREAYGREVGLVGACFLCLNLLHVRDSHFGTTDVAMSFFLLGSMFFIVRFLSSGRTGDALLAGAVAGLATTTKYAAVFLVVPMAVAPWVRAGTEGGTTGIVGKCARPLARLIRPVPLWGFGITAVVLFLLGSPYVALDFSKFLHDFTFEAQHLREGHAAVELGRGWWHHARYTLPYTLGWGLFAASVAGLVWAACRRRAVTLVLFLFPVVLYVVAGRGRTVFARYMLPLIPFFCLTAAYFVVEAARGLRRHVRPAILRLFLTVLLVVPSARNVLALDRLLATRDNRLLVQDWLAEHLAPGSTVLQTGAFVFSHVRLPRSLTDMKDAPSPVPFLPETVRLRPGERPDFVLVQRSPLRAHSYVPGHIEVMLEREYVLRETFIAAGPEGWRNWYDQQDDFYLPLRGFAGIERPGPNVFVYERRDRPDRELSPLTPRGG